MAVGEPPPRVPPHEVTEKYPTSLVFGSLHIQNSFVHPNLNIIKPQTIDTSSTKPSYADILVGASSKHLEERVYHSGLIHVSSIDGVSQERIILKPTTKYLGKPAVIFSNSDKLTLIQRLKYVLVAKFSHGKPGLNTVKEFFANFNLKSRCNISVYDSKHLFLECEAFDDFVKIWLCKNCMVGGFLMRLFKWREDFDPSFESPICPVWVHLPGLPLYLYHEEILMSIANAIGRPLALDLDNINRSKLGCATFCVEVDISIAVIDKIWIAFDKVGHCVGKKGIWQKVIHDPLPSYCSRCAHLGHAIDSCLRMDNLFHNVVRGDIVEAEGLSGREFCSGGLQGKGIQLQQTLSAINHDQSAVLEAQLQEKTEDILCVDDPRSGRLRDFSDPQSAEDTEQVKARATQKSGVKHVTESEVGNAMETVDSSCVSVETVNTRIRTDLKDQERKFSLHEEVHIEDITLEEREIDGEAVGAEAVESAAVHVAANSAGPAAVSGVLAVEKLVAAREHLVGELAVGEGFAGERTQQKQVGKLLANALIFPGNQKGKLSSRHLARKLNANKKLFKKREAAYGAVTGMESAAQIGELGTVRNTGSGQNWDKAEMIGTAVVPLSLEEGEIARDGHENEIQEQERADLQGATAGNGLVTRGQNSAETAGDGMSAGEASTTDAAEEPVKDAAKATSTAGSVDSERTGDGLFAGAVSSAGAANAGCNPVDSCIQKSEQQVQDSTVMNHLKGRAVKEKVEQKKYFGTEQYTAGEANTVQHKEVLQVNGMLASKYTAPRVLSAAAQEFSPATNTKAEGHTWGFMVEKEDQETKDKREQQLVRDLNAIRPIRSYSVEEDLQFNMRNQKMAQEVTAFRELYGSQLKGQGLGVIASLPAILVEEEEQESEEFTADALTLLQERLNRLRGDNTDRNPGILSDGMGDIHRPFKIKSAPNSPKGKNSSYDSSTYLLSRRFS